MNNSPSSGQHGRGRGDAPSLRDYTAGRKAIHATSEVPPAQRSNRWLRKSVTGEIPIHAAPEPGPRSTTLLRKVVTGEWPIHAAPSGGTSGWRR